MNNYAVVWEINVTARTPLEAAHLAVEIQRDVYSEALCFEVIEDATEAATFIDLMETEA